MIICIFMINHSTFSQADLPWHVEFDFETIEYKNFITLDSSLVWQVGEPSKSYLDTAFSGAKVIMTDTLNPYPANTKDCFYLIIDPIKYLWFGYTICELEFQHKTDCDTITEGGYIEVSYDKGKKWKNIIYDSIHFEIDDWTFTYSENFYEKDDTLETGMPAFSGNHLAWQYSKFMWGTGGVKKNSIDTVLIRFCFLSDSIQTNKDGWMIDDIKITVITPSNINKNNHYTGIRVIPNPVKDISLIDLSHINTPERIIVYSSTGLKVIDDYLDAPEYQISRSDLSPGIYFIRVITEDEKVYSGSHACRQAGFVVQ